MADSRKLSIEGGCGMSGGSSATQIAQGASSLGSIANSASGLLSIGSAASGAAGSLQQGEATQAANNANAQVATQNAAIAQNNAVFAAQAGEIDAGIQGEKNQQTMGTTRAAEASAGGSGVDVNSGSAANVQASQAMLGQMDELNIRAAAAKAAYGYQTQAVGFQGQAAQDIAAGQNAATAGTINAITGATSGLAKAAASGAFGGTNGNADKTTNNAGSSTETAPSILSPGDQAENSYFSQVQNNSLNSSDYNSMG